METQLIKKTFKLGNSAGVLLPINWKNKKVKIEIIEKSITKDILEILEEKDLLKNTIGIYLAGSYARGEETESSDIDILIITDNINKQIKVREYEIVLISKEKFEKNIEKNLYLISLVSESKTIINNDYISKFKGILNELCIKKHIGEIKSIIKINEESISIDEQLGKKVSDETLYSLILRLRELYLIENIKNNKKATSKEFIGIIKKITGSIEPYDSYLRIKNDKKSKEIITIDEAKKLLNHAKEMINWLEHDKKR